MLADGASFKFISNSLQINNSRQLQRPMTRALGHHLKMFHHMSVDEVCRKIK